MPYTSPRPRLRPLNLARLETETETLLHKVFMPVTSLMVKVYIRDRVRDRDLENGLYESETETETLESRDTRDETRVSSVSAVYTCDKESIEEKWKFIFEFCFCYVGNSLSGSSRYQVFDIVLVAYF